jgi:hypothetical protein
MDGIKAEAEALTGVLGELAKELETLLKGRQRDTLSQPERRMHVRSISATIEAFIYVWKQTALRAHPDPKCPAISEAERAFAQEQEYRLADSGDIEIRRTKISLEANLRFAFKLLAKACSVPFELDLSGSEWPSFRRAIKIRDRITHPKSVSDLNISDEDANDVSEGFGWFLISHVKLATAIMVKTKSDMVNAKSEAG